MKNVEIILEIHKEITENGYITKEKLTEITEKSERTIYRYIETLKNLGFPIKYDKKCKRYYYSYEFNEINFFDQKFVLIFSFIKKILDSNTILPNYDLINISHIPKKYLEAFEIIEIKKATLTKVNINLLINIFSAALKQNIIHIEYTNRKNIKSTRYILPLKLIFYEADWYILSHDYLNNNLRIFRCSRMKNICFNDNITSKFKKPKYNKSDLKYFINQNFGIFLDANTSQWIKIRFHGEAKNSIRNQIWHENQKVSEYGNYIDLEIPVSHPTEIISKIFSYGEDAEIISPQEYRRLWLEKINSMYQKFIKKFQIAKI